MKADIEREIMEYGHSLPSDFVKQKRDILSLEFVVAERKAFLSRQKLTYRCSLKVDEDNRVVKFFETLKERGSGLSSGGDGISPGFGFKVEKTSLSGSRRDGNIKELSVLFGKRYSYDFNYQEIREKINTIAANHNYRLDIVLSERRLV